MKQCLCKKFIAPCKQNRLILLRKENLVQILACKLYVRDDTYMTSMKIFQFSRPPPPLFIYVQNSSTPLTLDALSPNDNQSIKRKNNPMVLPRPSLRSAFLFSISSLIISGFPFTSFRLAEASRSAFLWLYTLVCAVVQTHHEMSFIYNYSHL